MCSTNEKWVTFPQGGGRGPDHLPISLSVCRGSEAKPSLGCPSTTALALGQETPSTSQPYQSSTMGSPNVFSSPAALDPVIARPPVASGLKSILSTSIHQQTAPSASPCPGNPGSGLYPGLQGLGERSDHHIPGIPVGVPICICRKALIWVVSYPINSLNYQVLTGGQVHAKLVQGSGLISCSQPL